jgi:hypothetical protein
MSKKIDEEIRDVKTFQDQNKLDRYVDLLREAQDRARKTAENLVDEIKKTNKAVMEKLEKNIKLTPDDKKEILVQDQGLLRKKLMSEVVQTKASMILVEKKINELTAKNEILKPEAEALTGYEQVVVRGRVKANESMILKLQLQRQYLEGIFAELSKTLQQVKEMIMIDRVTPALSEITDLLTEVDKIQAESDELAGRADKAEAEADVSRDTEEER